MINILVTGATGFVGQRLTEQLSACNRYRVTAASRQTFVQSCAQIRSVLIDGLEADTDWSSALNGIDVVAHCAARVHIMNDHSIDPLEEFCKVNFEGTLNLARQAQLAGVKRFIFISSIKVNGEETFKGRPFTADDEPVPIDPYGISKAEAEKALLELAKSTGLEIVIIRPVLVYGPGVKANFRNLMKWLNMGVPLPLGLISNKRSLVALDNLVDLIVTCTEHPGAVNQVFLVSDDEDLSTTELLLRVGKAMDRSVKLLPVPACLIGIAATLVGKRGVSQRLLGSLQVDISKTRELLGWAPPVSVDEALKKTVQSYLLEK